MKWNDNQYKNEWYQWAQSITAIRECVETTKLSLTLSLLKRFRWYTFKMCVPDARQILLQRIRWQDALEPTSDELTKTINFSALLRWFEFSSFQYHQIKRKDVLNQVQGKWMRMLYSQLSFDKQFSIDGRKVCSQFFPKALTLSNDMWGECKVCLKEANASSVYSVWKFEPVVLAVPTQIASSRIAIKCFVQKLEKNVSIIVPDRVNRHLSCFRRK